MRIASTQYQSMINISLQKNQERITNLTEQMSSGNRILVPSDDPVDSVRLSRLKREEAAIGQYRDNVAAVTQRMSKNEAYLSNMVDDLSAGRDLLVWASNGGNTPQDLNAMVTSLTSLRDSVMYTSNTLDQEGRYVFSGTKTDVAPITYDASQPLGARYKFTGNTNAQNVLVGNGITQVANQNVSGVEAFLNKLDSTIAALANPAVDISNPAVAATVKSGLDGIDATMNLLSGKVATLGGQQNILKTIDANHANISLSNQSAILDIGQADIGAAAMDLNGYTTALQASYKAYSKIGNLSLFAVL
jgi:flagellar hook-associated protein 3 FlgL